MLISDNPLYQTFLETHRWAVLTTLRADGGPVSSVVAFALDAGSLVVSTPGATFKRACLDQNPRLNLCVITNQEPFNFVAIEGHASIETEQITAATKLVFRNIEGTGYKKPRNLDQWLIDQARVIIRIHPDRVYGVIR